MDSSLNKIQFFSGKFSIWDSEYDGTLKIDREINRIELSCTMILRENPVGPVAPFGSVDFIQGRLIDGSRITLLYAHCIDNFINVSVCQTVVFLCDSLLWYNSQDNNDLLFNNMEVEIENGLLWCDMTNLKSSMPNIFEIGGTSSPQTFSWFGTQIKFTTTLQTNINAFPRKEECFISEHLIFSINSSDKKPPKFFIQIRNKILALISFAIKNNVNIISQKLCIAHWLFRQGYTLQFII